MRASSTFVAATRSSAAFSPIASASFGDGAVNGGGGAGGAFFFLPAANAARDTKHSSATERFMSWFAPPCSGPAAALAHSVIVNPNPTFIASNFSTEICSGDQTNILFGSATPGHQINAVSVNYGFVTGGTVNPGVTTFNSATPLIETLFNNTNSAIDVVYEFNVTTPLTTPVCSLSPVSQFGTVRVNPNPTFVVTDNTGGGSGTICSGSQTNILLNTAVSGGHIRLKAVTYGAVTGTLTPGILFTNGQSITEVMLNSTGSPVVVNYEFEAIVGSCGPSASQFVNITVNPNPNVVALPASQTICSGAVSSIGLSPTNGVGGVTYSWTRVDAGVSGVLVGTGTSIAETLTATGSTPGTATYTTRGLDANAVAPDGTVYVTALDQKGVPRITSPTDLTYIAGGFRGPSDLAFTPDGRIVVANFDSASLVQPGLRPQLPFALDILTME